MNCRSEFCKKSYFVIAGVSLLEIDDQQVVKHFCEAASKGDVSMVVDMLRGGVPVDCCNEEDQTALHLAATNNRIDVVNVLLKSGANVN